MSTAGEVGRPAVHRGGDGISEAVYDSCLSGVACRAPLQRDGPPEWVLGCPSDRKLIWHFHCLQALTVDSTPSLDGFETGNSPRWSNQDP